MNPESHDQSGLGELDMHLEELDDEHGYSERARDELAALQVTDSQHMRTLLRRYALSERPAYLNVYVVDSSSTFSSLVKITIDVPAEVREIKLYYPTRLNTEGQVVEKQPITYCNAVGYGTEWEPRLRGGASLIQLSKMGRWFRGVVRPLDGSQSARTDEENGGSFASGGALTLRETPGITSTTFSVAAQVGNLKRYRVELDLEAAFVMLPATGLADEWQLTIGVELPGATATLVRLEHPAAYGLRSRVDNSEYHSLAQGVSSTHVRKTCFFPGATVLMSYRYGLADLSGLRNLSRVAFAAAFGLLAAGVMLAFIKADFESLSASILAFVILPPLAQVALQGRASYGSADIPPSRKRWIILVAPLIVYIPLVAAALMATVDYPAMRNVVQLLCYIFGLVVGGFGALILGAVDQQVVPRHYCDRCSSRIYWRRRSTLDISDRRTLCDACAKVKGLK